MASTWPKHPRTSPIFSLTVMVEALDRDDDMRTIQRVSAEVSRVLQHANSIVDLARDHKRGIQTQLGQASGSPVLDICPTCVGIGADVGQCADCGGQGIERARHGG